MCIEKQRCRDGVINDFLSQSRYLLCSLSFHNVMSLYIHPPSFQRNDLLHLFHILCVICGKTPLKNGMICKYADNIHMHFVGCFGEFC